MGKSLGNALAVDEVLKHVRPVELRYYLAARYRSTLEFSTNPSPSRLSDFAGSRLSGRDWAANQGLQRPWRRNAQTPSWPPPWTMIWGSGLRWRSSSTRCG